MYAWEGEWVQREAEAPWFDLGIAIYQVAIGEEREGVSRCLWEEESV